MQKNAVPTKKMTLAERMEIRHAFWNAANQHRYKSNDVDVLFLLKENPWLTKERVPSSSSYHARSPFLHALFMSETPHMLALAEVGLALGACVHDRGWDGETPLQRLMYHSWQAPLDTVQASLADLLVKAGARCDSVSDTGHNVWSQGGAQMPVGLLKRFISQGASLDFFCVEDKYEDKPVHLPALSYAIYRTAQKSPSAKNEPVCLSGIEVLLQQGANPNMHSPFDLMTAPLGRALIERSQSMADLLLQHGADVNLKDGCGRGFLHLATNDTTVQWLVKNGADLEMRDAMDRTPLLHLMGRIKQAATKDAALEPVALTMMLAGADLNAHDAQAVSETPREMILAEKKHRPDLCSAMQSIQARLVAMSALDEMFDTSPSP